MASHQMQQGANAAEPPADEAGAAREPAHVSAEEPEPSGRPEVQFAPGVLGKLLAFSLALAALPLSLLFATRHGYLDGGRPRRFWLARPWQVPSKGRALTLLGRAAAVVSAFVGRLTPDTRLFAGAVVAVVAVNVVRQPAALSCGLCDAGLRSDALPAAARRTGGRSIHSLRFQGEARPSLEGGLRSVRLRGSAAAPARRWRHAAAAISESAQCVCIRYARML